MLNIYLLGGENTCKRNARQINQKAFQDAACQPPTVLVLPWARASFDRKYQKRKSFFDYLRSLGAENVFFAEYADKTENLPQKFADSHLVYLTGGQPSILIERLEISGVDKLLKNYCGVIVGRSAGALALCQRGIATPRSTSKPKIVTGIGLVDITLKVHYKPEEEEKLKVLSKKVGKIYAVPERSSIFFDGKDLMPVNQVFLFYDGKKQILNYEEKSQKRLAI